MLVKSYVDRGTLVPDDIMTRLMLPRLEQLSTHSWLLDGESNNVCIFVHVCDSYICPVFVSVCILCRNRFNSYFEKIPLM